LKIFILQKHLSSLHSSKIYCLIKLSTDRNGSSLLLDFESKTSPLEQILYMRPRQTFLTEEPKSENNFLREPENDFIENFI
jgi:hypothetical protein